jgi:hypothetical protein
MRWIRLFVAVAMGLSLSLWAPGTARAEATQSLVNAGSAAATARGTTVGIALYDRATGSYADNGGNARLRFGSASIVKLFIADSVLRRASLGQLSLSQADRDKLGIMLRSSDDAAASNLWSRFGSSGIVNDVIGRYALTETQPPVNPRYWGVTQISAHDLTVFYLGMLSGAGGLPASDRDWIVGQLRQATAHGTDGVYQWFGLHDALPRESVLGIKQGWMCCMADGHLWRHSTGIVGPDSRYIVVVLARDAGSAGAAHTEASTTRAVQEMFPAGLIPRVQGGIGDHWYATGGPRGPLGLPVTGELPAVGGAWTAFEYGRIYWSPGTGAHWIRGGVLSAWAAARSEYGTLGYPTSDEMGATGGARQAFQGGVIYWSPSTDARWIRGSILQAWGAQGYENGPLGYPSTNELTATGGAWQAFQKGRVYWSPATGAHWLTGAVLKAWVDRGAENGALGYPVSEPRAVSGGTRADFQRGSLTVTSSGQVVASNSPTPTPAPAPTTSRTTTATPAPTTTPRTTTAPSTTAPSTTAPRATTSSPSTSSRPTTTSAPSTTAPGTPTP